MKGIGEIAIVHGHAAAHALAQLARTDPDGARQIIQAALNPSFVAEKLKCEQSARLAKDHSLTDEQYQKARRKWGV